MAYQANFTLGLVLPHILILYLSIYLDYSLGPFLLSHMHILIHHHSPEGVLPLQPVTLYASCL